MIELGNRSRHQNQFIAGHFNPGGRLGSMNYAMEKTSYKSNSWIILA